MVLSQFIITPQNNGAFFPVGISGKCSIRVLGVQYSDDKKNDDIVVQIQSDTLYFPNSPARYITILSAPHNSVAFDQGRHDYHLNNTIVNASIRLTVVDGATGVAPTHFSFCVLTLSIEAINRNLPVDEVFPA